MVLIKILTALQASNFVSQDETIQDEWNHLDYTSTTKHKECVQFSFFVQQIVPGEYQEDLPLGNSNL